jgi:hypothetical protein
MHLRHMKIPTSRAKKTREEWGTRFVQTETKKQINIKGDGQECPSYMGYFLGRDSGGTRPAPR